MTVKIWIKRLCLVALILGLLNASKFLRSRSEHTRTIEAQPLHASTSASNNSQKLSHYPARNTSTFSKEQLLLSNLSIADSQESISKCFPLNSYSWLYAQKHSNPPLEVHELHKLREQLIDYPKHLLSLDKSSIYQQSLCTSESGFRTLTHGANTTVSRRVALVRLLYTAIYHHQHGHALAEARSRLSQDLSCRRHQRHLNVGDFDFECPTAKFLVVRLAPIGLGAIVGIGAVKAFTAGFASNRIVLFAANVINGTDIIREPWPLASCPRKDYHCFFKPFSPCTPTLTELEKAHLIEDDQLEKVLRGDRFEHDEDRVLIVNMQYTPVPKIFKLASTAMYSISRELLTHSAIASADSTEKHEIEQAAALLFDNFDERKEISAFFDAILIYCLRPNSFYAPKVRAILDSTLPTGFEVSRAIGLPVRASDKCGSESECLTFEQHMQVTTKTWQRFGQTTTSEPPFLIFTTESKEILQAQQDYVTNQNREQYRFIRNEYDIMPSTGRLGEEASSYADEAMLSAISSLQAQLFAQVTIGNCCSNFHQMLRHLLRAGCGQASNHHFQCLQDDDDPLFAICCLNRGDVALCVESRAQALINRTNAM